MIKKGDFVRISYTAMLEDGTVIDTTDEKTAREFGIYNENIKYGDIIVVVGEGHVLKGLDEALEGKKVGYKGKITVPPEKAFGKYDPDKKEIINISRLKEKPRVGQRIKVGDKVGVVERIIGRKAIVDLNHPYAGKNITFEFEIKDLIKDEDKKVESLFLIHTGFETKCKIENNKAVVEIPSNATFSQRFIFGKIAAVNSIFKYTSIKEVLLVEKYVKEDMEKVEERKEEATKEAPKEEVKEVERIEK